jgi:hypothetical protein
MRNKRNDSLSNKPEENVLNFPNIKQQIDRNRLAILQKDLSEQLKQIFASSPASKIALEMSSVIDFVSLIESVIESKQSVLESIVSKYYYSLMSGCAEIDKHVLSTEKENAKLKDHIFIIENTLKNLDTKNSDTIINLSIAVTEIVKLSKEIKENLKNLEWWHAKLISEYKHYQNKISTDSELVMIFMESVDEFNTSCFEEAEEVKDLIQLQEQARLDVDAVKLQKKECEDGWSGFRVSSFEKINEIENSSIDSCKKCSEYVNFMHEMNKSLDFKNSVKPSEFSNGLITEDDFNQAWEFAKSKSRLEELQNQVYRIKDKINELFGLEINFDQTVKAVLDLTEINMSNLVGLNQPKNQKAAPIYGARTQNQDHVYNTLIALAWIKTGNNNYKRYATVRSLLRIAVEMKLLDQDECDRSYESLAKIVREDSLSLTKDDFIKETEDIWNSCKKAWITCMDSYGPNRFFVRLKISAIMKTEALLAIENLKINSEQVIELAKDISKERRKSFRTGFVNNK